MQAIPDTIKIYNIAVSLCVLSKYYRHLYFLCIFWFAKRHLTARIVPLGIIEGLFANKREIVFFITLIYAL